MKSPLFYGKRSSKGLSAGRVQSVALRIICDREEAIPRLQAGRILDHRWRVPEEGAVSSTIDQDR